MKSFSLDNRGKNGQAAMEFLMTYGWAVLVVVAAISALAYFNILSPEKFLPDKCILESGMACIGHKVEPSQITLVITNNKGKIITIDNIKVGKCSEDFSDEMLNGEDRTLIVSGCTNGFSREEYSGDITISYTEKDSGLSKKVYGTLNTKVE